MAQHNNDEFRRRCERIIDSLPIRYPFDVTVFLADLGVQRGKPLVLWRMDPNDTLPMGMLIDTHDEDYLFVVRDTSPSHLHHIAFHEVWHLLQGQRCHNSPDAAMTATGSDEEKQAERFAYLLAAHVSSGDRQHRHACATGAQHQLRSAFGSRRQLCSGRA